MERNEIQVLADTVQDMQKCLECSICLHTFVSPVTTRCNHIFCKKCIGKLFSKKGTKTASCPLCKESVTRRSIFRCEQYESCVLQLQKLITAIETDTGVNLLSYARLSCHSKESNTPLKVGQTGGNPQRASVRESTRQASARTEGERKSLPQSSSKRNQDTAEYLHQASTSKDTRFGVIFDASGESSTDNTVLIPDTPNRPEKPADIRVNSTGSAQTPGDPSVLDRTSCDKLSSSNQNWSQVKIFGKEMRKRKKKKMSPLEISIESGKRTEKSVELTNENTAVRTRASLDSEEPIVDNSGGTKSNMPESSRNNGVPEKESLGANPRLPTIEDTYPRASSTPKNPRTQVDLSTSNYKSPLSDTLPLVGSPFLTFEEGTQVRIRSLSDHQMKDILGITCTQESNVVDKDKPLKKRTTPHSSPLLTCTPSRKSPEKSPRAQAPMQQDKPCDLVTPPTERQSDKEYVAETQILPSPGLPLTPTGILSSKEDNVEILTAKSSSLSSQGAPRLATVKRDLSKVITQIRESSASASAPKRSVPVAFKKLGRITQHGRAKPCKFLYLGACRQAQQSTLVISTSVLTSLKPCNTVETRTSEAAGNFPQFQGSLENDEEVTFTKTIVANESNERTSLTRDSNETMKARCASRTENTSRVKGTSRNEENAQKEADARKIMTTNAVAGTSTSRIPIQDSIDVVFESQIEPAVQKVPSPNAPRASEASCDTEIVTPKKRTHINGVKLLSPEKDSQLQFLSIDSPMMENARTPKLQRKSTNILTSTNLNTSGVMGAHSRELIRRSQRSNSENSECETPRKRKRPVDDRNASQSGSKKHEAESDGSDNLNSTVRSFGSTITQKRTKSQKSVIKSSTDESEVERRIPSHSSDTDIMSECDEPPRKKKAYRRIKRLSTSSGEAEVIDVDSESFKNSAGQSIANPPATKRPFLPNADVNINIVEIAESWCTDAYARGVYSKGRVDRTTSNLRDNPLSIRGSSNLPRMPSVSDNPLSSKDLFDSEPFSIAKQTDFNSDRDRQVRTESDVIVEDNDEFNSIIDRVRKMQKTESDRPIANTDTSKDNRRKDEGAETDLLQDNFNDIIANADTALFLDEATLSSNNAPNRPGKNAVTIGTESGEKDRPRTSGRSTPKMDVLSPLSSCASDKENRDCQRPPKASLFGKRKIDLDKTPVKNDRTKNLHRTPTATTVNLSSSKLTICSPAEINKKVLENQRQPARDSESMKDSSCEQDSLMNITQHQLLMQQFEEDLFNAQGARGRRDRESPQNPNQDPSSPISKDTESCSGEEDDIVKSTPETKTKTKPRSISSNSSTRKSVTAQALQTIRDLSPGFEAVSVAETTDKATSANARGAATRQEVSPNLQRVSTSTTPSSRGYAETYRGSSVVGQTRKLAFVCSSLRSAEIQSTRELAGMFAANYSNQFHRDVTHVIVREDPETNAAMKTLKYLQGVAHKKWVVGYKWVVECLKERMLVDEEPYEVLDSCTFEAGPRNSRLRKSDLFEDFAFFCSGPYENITAEQYKDLLRATGGEVVDTLEALAASSRKYRIIVIQPDTHEDEIIEWYRKARAVPVADDWIVECISQYKLVSLYSYLQELLPQDVLALGYPSFLVKEDTDIEDSMDVSDDE